MYLALDPPGTWPADLRKRLRAARGYGGLSLDELAAKTGLGRQTIFRMESGERSDRIREMELREIARVCGLPYGFFTVDFTALEQLEPGVKEKLDSLADQLITLEAALALLVPASLPEPKPDDKRPAKGRKSRTSGKKRAAG